MFENKITSQCSERCLLLIDLLFITLETSEFLEIAKFQGYVHTLPQGKSRHVYILSPRFIPFQFDLLVIKKIGKLISDKVDLPLSDG